MGAEVYKYTNVEWERGGSLSMPACLSAAGLSEIHFMFYYRLHFFLFHYLEVPFPLKQKSTNPSRNKPPNVPSQAGPNFYHGWLSQA